MHTPARVNLGVDGRTAALEEGSAQLRARILSPAGAKFEVMDAQPLPASPHPEGQAKNEQVRKLAIHLTGISDSRLAVLLVPRTAKGEAIAQPPALSALAEW